ncbi:MAG: VOC family protein [Gaiellaceae bacterium]
MPASDLERAKAFSTEKLGLTAFEEEMGGVAFECGGDTGILTFPSPNAGKCPTTYAGWEVNHLETLVEGLKGKGVVFEEYDTPDYKTVGGIATFDEGGKAAWFKDSEGNILALSQME